MAGATIFLLYPEQHELFSEIKLKSIHAIGQQVRPDKANTWIELDFTDIYQANMQGVMYSGMWY